jgi:hypothetical protein
LLAMLLDPAPRASHSTLCVAKREAQPLLRRE